MPEPSMPDLNENAVYYDQPRSYVSEPYAQESKELHGWDISSHATEFTLPSVSHASVNQPSIAMRSQTTTVVPGGHKKKKKQRNVESRISSAPQSPFPSQADFDDYRYSYSNQTY